LRPPGPAGPAPAGDGSGFGECSGRIDVESARYRQGYLRVFAGSGTGPYLKVLH